MSSLGRSGTGGNRVSDFTYKKYKAKRARPKKSKKRAVLKPARNKE